MKDYLKRISEIIFSNLKPDEQLGLYMHSEESSFLRFSQSKVRQNTLVHQHELTLHFNKSSRTIKMRYNLTLNEVTDVKTAEKLIRDARSELLLLDPHPHFLALKNNGISDTSIKTNYPSSLDVPDLIKANFKDVDLAGFWCAGPLRQASINSEGQFHYFETDHYFFDYSIYNEAKAVKGYYSTDNFIESSFINHAEETKNKLNLLNKKVKSIKADKYNVYLEPMAVLEILTLLSYGSFSQSNYNKGYSPFKKLKNKDTALSSKFSINENFNLGLTPLFNSLGELSPKNIELITNGALKSLLVSSATAKEYNLSSNFAETTEYPRSLDVRAGTLEQKDILSKLDQGLYISNLHYINYSDVQTARLTGMTRFACFYVEKGEIVAPIQDLRFDDTIYNIFGENLIELTKETSTFINTLTYQKRELGAFRTPGMLINNFNFTL